MWARCERGAAELCLTTPHPPAACSGGPRRTGSVCETALSAPESTTAYIHSLTIFTINYVCETSLTASEFAIPYIHSLTIFTYQLCLRETPLTASESAVTAFHSIDQLALMVPWHPNLHLIYP